MCEHLLHCYIFTGTWLYSLQSKFEFLLKQEVKKPTTESTIFKMSEKIITFNVLAVLQYWTQRQNSVSSDINETERWWCKLDFKIECTVIICTRLTTCSHEGCIWYCKYGLLVYVDILLREYLILPNIF